MFLPTTEMIRVWWPKVYAYWLIARPKCPPKIQQSGDRFASDMNTWVDDPDFPKGRMSQ